MSKTYKNPPLTEAVCEFRFSVKDTFESNQVEIFYTKIKDFFPVPKKGKVHSLELKIKADAPEGEEQTWKDDFHEFEQYLSEDKKYLVQIDGGRLSIHRLKPYVSWTEFLPLIQVVYKAYIDTFVPDKILRIGLRYVNEIAIPGKNFRFGDYFKVNVSLPSLVEENQKSIFIGSVFEQENGRDAIKVQLLENQNTSPDLNRIFGLDLDYFLTASLNFSDVEEWLNKAHTNVENVFEGLISDKVRTLLES